MKVATCRFCDQFLRADGGGTLYAGDLAPDHRWDGRPCSGAGSEVRNAPPCRDPHGAPEQGDEVPMPGEFGSVIQVLEVWEDGDGWEVKARWVYRDGKSETETVPIWQWWVIVGFPAPSGIRLEKSGATLLWATGGDSGVVENLQQLARILRRLAEAARVNRNFRQGVKNG